MLGADRVINPHKVRRLPEWVLPSKPDIVINFRRRLCEFANRGEAWERFYLVFDLFGDKAAQK